jgi:4-methylaminobutanoate oxidase (formaldehyde-forming)
VANVMAKAARQNGATIIEKCPVKKILTKNNKIVGVETNYGKIECEYVVLATGMWSRQIAEEINVSIPLYPDEHFYEHFYILSEPISDIDRSLPVLRDYNNCLYLKEDAGKLAFGSKTPTNNLPASSFKYRQLL